MLQEKFGPPASEIEQNPPIEGDLVIATDADNNEVEGVLSEIVAVDGGIIRGKVTKRDGQEIDVIVKSKKDSSLDEVKKDEGVETILDNENKTSKTLGEQSLESFLLESEEKTKVTNPTKVDLLDLVKDDAEYDDTELRNKGGKKPKDLEPPDIEQMLDETSDLNDTTSEQQEKSPIEDILSRTTGPKDSTFDVFDTSGDLKKLKELIENAPRPQDKSDSPKLETENTSTQQTETQPIPETPIIESSQAPLESIAGNNPTIENQTSERIEITEATKPDQSITESPTPKIEEEKTIKTLPKKRGRKPKTETTTQTDQTPISIESINSDSSTAVESVGQTTSQEIENSNLEATEQVIPENIPKTGASIPVENNPEIPETAEKELTIEERLDSARSKYAEYLSKNELNQKKWDSGKGFDIAENTEAELIRNQLLPEAKKDYLEARSLYLKEKINEYKNGALEKELRTYFGNEVINLKSHSEKRLQEQSAIELHKEFKRLYDQKTENLAQSKKSTFLEKTLDKFRALGKSYSSQSTRKKVLLGLALGAGGVLAALGGGGVMGALGFLIGAGKLGQKIAAGSATFVTVEALIKRSQDKKLAELSSATEKAMLEKIKFASNLYERGERASGLTKFLEARNDILELEFNERYNDLEKTKRRMAKRRLLYSSAAGLIIGSGVIAKALSALADASGIHPLESLKDKVESTLGKEPSALGGRSTLSPESLDSASHPQPENLTDSLNSAESHPNILDHTPAPGADQAFESAKDLQEQISKPIATVKPGGNIWETAKSLVGEGKITESEFRTAWGNTTIEVNGVETPISEVGLSHPGDQLIFVGGANPHFEISSDFMKDHLKLGTNEDLYKYLKSTGKPIPNWLIEKFGK